MINWFKTRKQMHKLIVDQQKVITELVRLNKKWEAQLRAKQDADIERLEQFLSTSGRV